MKRVKDVIIPPDMEKAPPCWEPHNHLCQHCSMVWHHDPVDVLALEKSSKDFAIAKAAHDKAHECPQCGKNQGFTDGSGKVPTLLHNGLVTKPFEPSDQPAEDEERKRARMELQFQTFLGSLMNVK